MPQASGSLNTRGQAVGAAPLSIFPVAELKLGMFVAELDRPWSDTPFLLEGLLLESENDLETITRLCREVTVDLSRSFGVEDVVLPGDPAAASSQQWEAASVWMERSDDRLSSSEVEFTAQATAQDTPDAGAPEAGYLLVRRGPIAWLCAVFRELLESYLRPRARALDNLPAHDSTVATRRQPAVMKTPGMLSVIARILRELTTSRRPQRTRVLAAVPGRAAMQGMTVVPDPEPGTWARVRLAIFQILSWRRRDAVEAPDPGETVTPADAALPQAANAPEYAGEPHRLPLHILLLRALLKMAGFGHRYTDHDTGPWSQTVSIDAADTEPGEITAAELAQAKQQAQRFDADVGRVAMAFRQSIRVMHAVFRRAEKGLPLAIETLDPVVTQIVDDMLRNQDATLWLARLQSHDQTAHARGMQAAVYMAHMGAHLGLPRDDLERLALAGVLLDIGKMRVAPEILRKPGALDADEMRQARSHVGLALQLLAASGGVDNQVGQAVERHHEREDGSGYPNRMIGDAIGLYGRIAGIVDTFLALSGVRAYAPPQPMDDCVRILLKGRGTLFHAPLVEHFIQMVGLYPVGSLVELSTGEVAAVLSHNRVRRLRPRVLLMIGADGVPLSRPSPFDLLYRPRDAAGNEIRIVRGLPVGSHGIKAKDLFAATVPQ